jgi:HNH endonuclease
VLRAHVRALVGDRCARCGRVGLPLQLHHRDHDVTNNCVENFELLCLSCHRKAGAEP